MSNNHIVDPVRLATTFKALSNPHRVEIFLRLVSCCVPGTQCSPGEQGSECVGELGRELGIAPSTVSHHIKELNRSGLVHMERRGRRVECWVDPEMLDQLSRFFALAQPGGPDDGSFVKTTWTSATDRDAAMQR